MCLACSGAEDEPSRFDREVQPILSANCVDRCHVASNPEAMMDLSPGVAESTLIGVPSDQSTLLRVDPGNSAQSYLMHKLDGTHLTVGGDGESMPYALPLLPEADRNVIRTYIDEL